MKKFAVFTVVFFVFAISLSAELSKAELWAVSLTGILNELNRSYRNSLNTSTMDERGRDTWLEVLERDWRITTREELLENLEILEEGGHTAALMEIKKIITDITKPKMKMK